MHGLFQSWHDNGKIYQIINYENDRLHGLYETWYNDGVPEQKTNFNKGKRHGLCEYWAHNGLPLQKYNYNNGVPHGLCESWIHLYVYIEDVKKINTKYVRKNMDNGVLHGIVSHFDYTHDDNHRDNHRDNHEDKEMENIYLLKHKDMECEYYINGKQTSEHEYKLVLKDISDCFNIPGVSNIAIGYYLA